MLSGTLLLLSALAGPARAEEAPAKPVAVPFELIGSKHIAIKIKINGKGPYRVIFDTGAPVSLVNNRVAKASGIVPKNYRPSPFAFFGAAGQFQIKELEVGGVKAANVPVIVMDHPTVQAISKVLGPVEGLVGFPFFARYKMTIDYQAKTITFVPNGFKPPDVMQKMMASLMDRDRPPPQVLAPAAQWGFKVHKGRGDQEAGVTIQEVLPGSAAAAGGLQAGDRLLSLDGRWTDSVAECYGAAGHVKPGTAAKVVVKRKDKEVELTVKPVAGL
jgi:hypothetical protein